jgi:multimeric flavodoxin WrbA
MVFIMKVLMLNGSPNEKGCTNRALEEIAKALAEEGIASEMFWVGNNPVAACIGCNKCSGKGRCVLGGNVNEFAELAKSADGFIFGSPVYYAAATGAITSFLDRVFFSRTPDTFRLKPGAAIVSARRAGTTATLDQLNKYFTVAEMPVISSRYWNMVHGKTPEEVEKDIEGLYTMRVLGKNMAWFLKCKEAGEKAGVPLPEPEDPEITNFIRYGAKTGRD